jgi:hypothetical protein
VTLNSLRNDFIHSPVIEDVRHKVRQLVTQNWTIHFGWVKAHTAIEGNERADKLVKEAAEEQDETTIAYKRLPITTVASGLKKKGLAKWQRQW